MEEIIIVKQGIEPTIYYPHTCSVCEAQLEIKKSTILTFLCPCCQSNETINQDPHHEIKKYNGKTIDQRKISSKNLLKKQKK